MPIISEDVQYEASGRPMHGRIFRDEGLPGPRPAVMVFPEGFGISEHTYDAARRIAELGYLGFACDLYGEGYFHNGPTDYLVERNAELTTDRNALRAIGTSALDVLASRDEVDDRRIAAIGYCLGGTVAIELGFTGAALAAISTFHPTFRGLTFADAGATRCPIQLFLGSDDFACPPAARAEFEEAMRDTGVSWQMTIYGGVKHSFTNPNCQGMGDAVRYDAEADRHSWRAMAALFERALAGE
jgi:dienelactone hydrolase